MYVIDHARRYEVTKVQFGSTKVQPGAWNVRPA
jgi:hypothetical protein